MIAQNLLLVLIQISFALSQRCTRQENLFGHREMRYGDDDDGLRNMGKSGERRREKQPLYTNERAVVKVTQN